MARNYYIILGVNPQAGLGEIKAAYRQQAKEYHPDLYGESPEPFLEVQEAYSVLSDPDRRRFYDQYLRNLRVQQRAALTKAEPLVTRRPFAEPFPQGEPESDLGCISVSESFEAFHPSMDEIFDRLLSNFENITRPKSETMESLTVEISLTPDQAETGGHAMIMVPARVPCPTCRGCGQLGLFECWRCGGEKTMVGESPVPVAFPPNMPGQYTVRIPLDQFGIHNFYLTVFFRVSEMAG